MMEALIDNAIKDSSPKSNIIIEFKQSGKYKVLKISNQSAVMTEEECHHIFDGFYRFDQTRGVILMGSGLDFRWLDELIRKF